MPRAVDAKLNTKLDKLTFQNRCADLLVRLGVQPVDCSLRPFTVALLAHGDINHSVTASFPFNVSFGLGNYTGKMASGSGWKTALETGRVLPATALDLPKLVPSPVSFNGGEAGMFRRTTECW
jgi:hypothetical protein